MPNRSGRALAENGAESTRSFTATTPGRYSGRPLLSVGVGCAACSDTEPVNTTVTNSVHPTHLVEILTD
jgi:hypothetical protein